LEAYDKFYNRRNVHSVQFEFVYPKQFLDMHGKISKILETDRVEARLAGLYRGENAIKNTIAKVIDNMMDNNRVWHMFKAMQDYATDNDLIDIGDRDRLNNDSEIRLFLEKFFDAVVSDTVDTYQIDSYFEEKSPWAVTYDNLYVTRRNLSFLVVETFKD